jgi:hypothetical protein
MTGFCHVAATLKVLSVTLHSLTAVIDENGQWQQGGDPLDLAPEIRESDREAAIDLSQQPPEKLFRLLAWELMKEDKRPQNNFMKFGEFQDIMDLTCHDRLLYIMKITMETSEEITDYHNNITGTSGLYWLLHKFPDENSWIWLLTTSHERLLRNVNLYLSKLAALTLDKQTCISSEFRAILMDAALKWKRLSGDWNALVWNGLAFGLYGDVTSWRDTDNETGKTEDGPGGDPPNVTWSENLIFGNMWSTSLQKWFEAHANLLLHSVRQELPRIVNMEQSSGTARRMHHQDDAGMFASFEYLRRVNFGQWALDKGLLRGLIRHVWQPQYGDADHITVGDFGAGGGQYSTWMNETGLLKAFAFDGSPRATEITGGKVQEINLVQEFQLWRTFDWVLCLEVAEHIPKEFSTNLIQNLKRHARKGLIISWSSDWEGIGHVNCLSEEEFYETIQRETGFVLDLKATEVVRKNCEIDYIGRGVAIFRATESTG